jgi:hypothetical protein
MHRDTYELLNETWFPSNSIPLSSDFLRFSRVHSQNG